VFLSTTLDFTIILDGQFANSLIIIIIFIYFTVMINNANIYCSLLNISYVSVSLVSCSLNCIRICMEKYSLSK
jgi:hypothetical protein